MGGGVKTPLCLKAESGITQKGSNLENKVKKQSYLKIKVLLPLLN